MNSMLCQDLLEFHPKVCKLNREFLANDLNTTLFGLTVYEQHLKLVFSRSFQLGRSTVVIEVLKVVIC
jgi:hypothetical protein